MARSMLSDCSERCRWPLAGLLLSCLIVSAAPAADVRWRSGVFPVAAFAGYTSHFGQRLGPAGQMEAHRGLDIAAPLGSPVLSWWSGCVVSVIDDSSCGIGVVIASGDYEHIYCHLQDALLRQGQAVLGGQLIGRVGMTGRTTGPHLHWGIRYQGRWMNPALILKAMISGKRAQGATGP